MVGVGYSGLVLTKCNPLRCKGSGVEISFANLVEILHGGGGGDVEHWLEPRNKFLVFAIGFLIAFSLLYISIL